MESTYSLTNIVETVFQGKKISQKITILMKNGSEDFCDLPIGTKIQYLGDMANIPAKGEIINADRSILFSPVYYDIKLCNNAGEERIEYKITPNSFVGVGKRFEVI